MTHAVGWLFVWPPKFERPIIFILALTYNALSPLDQQSEVLSFQDGGEQLAPEVEVWQLCDIHIYHSEDGCLCFLALPGGKVLNLAYLDRVASYCIGRCDGKLDKYLVWFSGSQGEAKTIFNKVLNSTGFGDVLRRRYLQLQQKTCFCAYFKGTVPRGFLM